MQCISLYINCTVWLHQAHVQSCGNIRMSSGHCFLHSHGVRKSKRTGLSAYLGAVSKAVKCSGRDKSLIQCSEAVTQPHSHSAYSIPSVAHHEKQEHIVLQTDPIWPTLFFLLLCSWLHKMMQIWILLQGDWIQERLSVNTELLSHRWTRALWVLGLQCYA